MYTESQSLQNRCYECNLNFDTAHELQNHKRRFCVNSGYDNLQGLAKIQWQGGSPPHKPKFSHKNHLQQYGSNSLSHLNEHNHLNEDNLNTDMKNINRFKRQIEKVHKYKHTEPSESHINTSKSQLNQTRLTHNSFSESKLDEQLKKYQKPLKEMVSPPTFIDQLNMRNYTMLDKSNSTMARMPHSDKIEYAKIKLDQLNEIKAQYIQNGGKKPEFKDNVQKMVHFYQKFLSQQQNKQKQEYDDNLNNTQKLIDSRCSTPILKLRNLQESKVSQVSSTTNRTKRKQQTKSKEPTQQFPGFNGQPFGYPPFMMMPYPQPPPQSNDSIRLLEKMMELKSDENKHLMEILLQDRKKQSQPQINGQMEFQKTNQSKRKKKKGVIDVEEEYQFKKEMIDDLISEEKVLLALQQEQLDELKLLSQLPKDLQQIKMQTVIKASDTRFQVEKQLLKQKMNRLAYQGQNQTFQEQRKLNNDRWAGQERKKLLQDQVDKYIDNFQSHFNSN